MDTKQTNSRAQLNRLRLNENPMVGIFSKTTDSSIIEAVGLSGMDFVILDMEHGPADLLVLQEHIRAAELTGMLPIVRVKGLNSNEIGSVLDIGAAGVQVPNITNAEEANKAVEYARFHPQGNRGVCRFVRAAAFGKTSKKEYFSNENSPLIIIQVEGVEGINNIDSILEVEGYDVLFIGPYDLSQSLGIPGQVDHPKVQSLIEQIISKANNKEKILGIFVENIDTFNLFYEKGVNYLSYSVDIAIFRDACQLIVNNRGGGN